MIARYVRWLAVALVAGLCCGGCQPQKKLAALPPIDGKSPGCVPAVKNPERHDGFMRDKAELLKNGPIDMVILGDSITDGWRGSPQNEIYQKAFGKFNAFNTGIGGDMTQHVLWRIDHGELDGISPKVAMIMIGTNNLGWGGQNVKQTMDGVRCVVDTVAKKLPHTKILLLAIFPRGEKADDPFRAKIKEVNAVLAQLPACNRNVIYLDIGAKFLADDGTLPKYVMPDALHPNAVGYQIWADAVGPLVNRLEGVKPCCCCK